MTEARRTRRARESALQYGTLSLDERNLKEITRRIVRAMHPKMIVLFGSRAYGKPRSDSDVDLLVVTDKTGDISEHRKILGRALEGIPFHFDIHTRTPDELTNRLEMGDDFMQEIVGRGAQVYVQRAANGFAARTRNALFIGKTHPKENYIVVQEWVEKAEEDAEAAAVLARQRKRIFANNLCWACEQCVEKYFKAFLTRHRVKFGRTHDLDELFKECESVDADFHLIQDWIKPISICKPEIRYPEHGVTEQEARDAFAASKKIRKFVRAKLGLH